MQPEEKVNILMVDDHPENLLALEAILEPLGQNLVKAHSGAEALKCLLNQDFAVILLDVQMPSMDGFETAELIRGRQRSQHTPIIFLTAINKTEAHVFKGYSLGAVDYLFKPIIPDVLRSKVGVFIELYKKSQALRQAHDLLERRVQERTASLVAANEALQVEITERHRVEESLRQSEARFRRLFEANIIGIIFADLEGTIWEANDAFLHLLGYTREDLQTNQVHWSGLTPDAYLAQDERALNEIRTTGLCSPFEKEYLTKNGTKVSVLIAGALLDDPNDRMVAFVLDITARKRAEDGLRLLAEAGRLLTISFDYRSALREVSNLVVPALADWCAIDVVNKEGGIERVITAALNPAREEIDRELQTRYPLDPQAPHGAPFVIRTGQPEIYTVVPDSVLVATAQDEDHLRLLRARGFTSFMSIPMEVRGQVLGALTLATVGTRRPFTQADLALGHSMARRIATTIDNARLYQEAQEAIRARDAFLSIAAHELKTPLTALMGYTDLLRRRADRDNNLPGRDARAIRVLSDQAERLNKMISSLLDLSRLQSGQLSIERGVVDLCRLARRLVEEVQPMLERHTISLECPKESVMVEGDELRLEQVLQNLIGNAIKYSPEGGSITVRVERQEQFAIVSITDQGIGVPAEALVRLFNRFYRANNVEAQGISGMGLGLYVVREIVTLHSGAIDVTSREGEGSTFTIRLPLHLPVLLTDG